MMCYRYIYTDNVFTHACVPDGSTHTPATSIDLRVIVLTYNRHESLKKLLYSLQNLDMDGDVAALEIWIDKSKDQRLDYVTFNTSTSFIWNAGTTTVKVHPKHVGIYGQWIDTWTPVSGSSELALILEDDMSVSAHAWKWIKAVHRHYGNRNDILGYTLQSNGVRINRGTSHPPKQHTVFLSRQMDSWSFIPKPSVWADFQRWFHVVVKDKSFQPYIGGNHIFDTWYNKFQKEGPADSMWTIWFIYYTNKHNLYCVYNNLNRHVGPSHSLAVNREEPGLHFFEKGKNNTNELLRNWNDSYVKFPEKTARYEFNGTVTWIS